VKFKVEVDRNTFSALKEVEEEGRGCERRALGFRSHDPPLG
jgi:hypothetical protein